MRDDDRELEKLKDKAARARRTPSQGRYIDDRAEPDRGLDPGGLWFFVRLVTPAWAKPAPFFIAGALFFLGFALPERLIPTYYLVAGSVYGGAIACGLLGLVIAHRRFRHWHRRLPFAVQGWVELARDPRLFEADYWRSLRIAVRLNEGASAEQRELVEAALEVFGDEVNRRVLRDRQRLNDGRKPWALTAPLAMEGSANVEVVRRLWKLCRDDLSLVARKTDAIDSIELRVGERVHYARKVDPTDQMMP